MSSFGSGLTLGFIDMFAYMIKKKNINTRQDIINRMNLFRRFGMSQEEYDAIIILLNNSENYSI